MIPRKGPKSWHDRAALQGLRSPMVPPSQSPRTRIYRLPALQNADRISSATRMEAFQSGPTDVPAVLLHVDSPRQPHPCKVPQLQPERLVPESREARQPGPLSARAVQPAPPQEARSESDDRADDEAAGRKNVGVWHAQESCCVICCCVADEPGATPAPGCTFCGGSGWALPCPACAGLGAVIDDYQRQPHTCEACGGRRVQPMLAMVEREAG
jgi:hypothetical protein